MGNKGNDIRYLDADDLDKKREERRECRGYYANKIGNKDSYQVSFLPSMFCSGRRVRLFLSALCSIFVVKQVHPKMKYYISDGGGGGGGNDISIFTRNAEETKWPKPILFVHFQKSGGTTMCRVISGVGSGIPNEQLQITDINGKPRSFGYLNYRNCNTEFSGPNHDVQEYHMLQTCRNLIPYTMDELDVPFRRNNFLAVEVPFQEQMPCHGYRSVALIRNPIDRLSSHLKMYNINEATLVKWMNERTPTAKRYALGYPVVNSMVIRQLLGRERFIDTKPIDEDDLNIAKSIVDRFDVFVPLEYLNEKTVQDILSRVIPELNSTALAKSHHNVNKKIKSWYTTHDERILEKVRAENKYDIMLYEYVLQKLGFDDGFTQWS